MVFYWIQSVISRTFTCALCDCKKTTRVVSLLSWPSSNILRDAWPKESGEYMNWSSPSDCSQWKNKLCMSWCEEYFGVVLCRGILSIVLRTLLGVCKTRRWWHVVFFFWDCCTTLCPTWNTTQAAGWIEETRSYIPRSAMFCCLENSETCRQDERHFLKYD